MTLLRSSVYFLGLVLSVIIFGLPLALLGWLFPLTMRNAYTNNWARLNMWMLKVSCGLDYRISGAENLPTTPAIVMSKHQSTWETISLRAIVGGNQSWVLKRELMWLPVFGWALAVMSPIAIDRKAGRKAVKQIIEQGTAHLQSGHHVLIFPEGTRTPHGSKGRYGIGGALLAEKSAYPVIPVAHNAGLFWARRGINKYAGTIDIVIGKPIETQGRSAKAIIQEVEKWIETTMATLPQQRNTSTNE